VSSPGTMNALASSAINNKVNDVMIAVPRNVLRRFMVFSAILGPTHLPARRAMRTVPPGDLWDRAYGSLLGVYIQTCTVRFGSYIAAALPNVHFAPESGHHRKPSSP